jgi:threonine synthase
MMCLDEFFRTGTYKSRSSQNTFETSSPSMDISKASNFETIYFDLLRKDAKTVKHLFAEELVRTGQFLTR